MDYNEIRRKTRKIRVGNIYIGGDAPVSVQSMTNTDSCDFDSTYRQIKALEVAGCELVRMAVPSLEAAEVLKRLKESDIRIPISADIHFDYSLAIAAAKAGADKIRINPGNIGADDKVRAVAEICLDRGIPIRIGVNGGSLDKRLLQKYGSATAEALAESALDNASMLLKYGFEDIILSVKSSNVAKMIRANEILAEKTDFPLHLGVTEAGSAFSGTVKNAVGIGALLSRGIGDTIRVSLTASPAEEIKSGREILKSLGILKGGIEIVSCPTCGRTKIDLISLVSEFESRLKEITLPAEKQNGLKVAIMGCVVNGPGEAREADIGACGGKGEGLIIRKGEVICKVPEHSIIDRLIEEINKL